MVWNMSRADDTLFQTLTRGKHEGFFFTTYVGVTVKAKIK